MYQSTKSSYNLRSKLRIADPIKIIHYKTKDIYIYKV